MKLLLQTLLASLIVAKIVLGSIFLYQIEFAPLFTETIAIASELKKDPGVTVNPDKKAGSGQAGEKETIDLSFIKKRNAELKEKEKNLEKKKIQLVALQEEINNKIATLSRLRDEIKAERTKKQTGEEQKLRHLIKIYSAMKPPKAASLIEKLDIKLAIDLLSKMKSDNVGSILSFVDVGKAAKISEGLLKK